LNRHQLVGEKSDFLSGKSATSPASETLALAIPDRRFSFVTALVPDLKRLRMNGSGKITKFPFNFNSRGSAVVRESGLRGDPAYMTDSGGAPNSL
jgi:hypothetical protein